MHAIHRQEPDHDVPQEPHEAVARLQSFLHGRSHVVALTGAGCSTASGIPDYRDEHGAWKRPPPVTYAAFTRSAAVRRRYWARSLLGWPRVDGARPSGAHEGLAALERRGRLASIVTQNVDGLHQRAGSRSVLDLHGRIAAVRCLACDRRRSRAHLQARLLAANCSWRHRAADPAPDGDADLQVDTSSFVVPTCTACGGMLKPDVVFFGENVPRARVDAAHAAVRAADALLVVGSSLRVFSGWRFVRAAHERAVPIAVLNLGCTRADEVATLRVCARCDDVLARLATT